jgi:hypothetical protein
LFSSPAVFPLSSQTIQLLVVGFVRADPEPVAVVAPSPGERSITAAHFSRPHFSLSRKAERWMIGILAKEPELLVRQPLDGLRETCVTVPEGRNCE